MRPSARAGGEADALEQSDARCRRAATVASAGALRYRKRFGTGSSAVSGLTCDREL